MTYRTERADLLGLMNSATKAMSSCARGAQWQLSMHLFHELPNAQIRPNIVTYNAVLSCIHLDGLSGLGSTLLLGLGPLGKLCTFPA